MKMKHVCKLLALVLFSSFPISCKSGVKLSVQYEIFAKNMQPFAEAVKRNYEEYVELQHVSFYDAKDSIIFVSFGYVASCQADTLQKRLSKERALYDASNSLFKLSYLKVYDSSNPIVYKVHESYGPDYHNIYEEGWTDNAEIYNLDSIAQFLFRDHIINQIEESKIRPLLKFAGEQGETVYGYYLTIPKAVILSAMDEQSDRLQRVEKIFQDAWDELEERDGRKTMAEKRAEREARGKAVPTLKKIIYREGGDGDNGSFDGKAIEWDDLDLENQRTIDR